jgi:hypothetical protein
VQTKIFLTKLLWERLGVLPVTPKQSDRVLNGLVRHPLGQTRLKFQRSSIKTILVIFFDFQGIVHKEFIPEGKTVNADFYTGVMDHLKRIRRVCPAAFCSQDFFLLHDNVPAHKARSVYQFLTQNMLQPFITPCTPDLSTPDYILFRKLKMKLKGLYFADVAEIQEAITDEFKKVQKEEFSAPVQKLCDGVKACIYASGAYFEYKKKRYVSSILKKKVSPKISGLHCVGTALVSTGITNGWSTRCGMPL